MRFWSIIIISLLLNSFSYARPVSAVYSDQCQMQKNTLDPFILVLKRGEDFFTALLRCANDAKLKSATISGLGALQDPTIGYYNLAAKKYKRKIFSGIFEIAAMNGNITQSNKQLTAHVHVVLGDEQYSTLSGHLFYALVGATAEITVIPLQYSISKKFDPTTGLNLISPDE